MAGMSMSAVVAVTGHAVQCALRLHYFARGTQLFAWASAWCWR